jgi:hypothetical protein
MLCARTGLVVVLRAPGQTSPSSWSSTHLTDGQMGVLDVDPHGAAWSRHTDVEACSVDRDFLLCGEPGSFGSVAEVVLLPAVLVAPAELYHVRPEPRAEAGGLMAGKQVAAIVTLLQV